MVEVGGDGARAEHEALGDLRRRQTVGDEAGHLELARAERAIAWARAPQAARRNPKHVQLPARALDVQSRAELLEGSQALLRGLLGADREDDD